MSQPPTSQNGHAPLLASDVPTVEGEGVIPTSFFDVPIDLGHHVNMDFDPMQGLGNMDFSAASIPNFDGMMTESSAPSFPMFQSQFPPIDFQQQSQAQYQPTAASPSGPSSTVPFALPQPPSSIGTSANNNAAVLATDFASNQSVPNAASGTQSPAPSAPSKPKKFSKPKAEGGESKPKKQKKKTSAEAPAEGDASNSALPKPKKTTKKKGSDKDKVKQEPVQASSSPAPFAVPASPVKETKSKKSSGGGGKGKGAKGKSTAARSVSRMSSAGRDMTTPALSRVGSQRPGDLEQEEEEAPPQRQAADEEQEEEDEAEADDGVEELGNDHFSTQEAIYAAQQRNMGLLSMVMDDEQLDRHMASRRGALNKTSVRKVVNHVLSQSVSQHVAMVVSGVAKIFVGEIVEKAREIQTKRGDSGPLKPNHLREAHRQYYLERERPGYYPPGTNTGFPGLGKRRRMF